MEDEIRMDLTRLLPADVLAEALRRLPRRGLAVARCVCKAWRSVVDGRGLTLPRLLPHSLGGIFLRFCGLYTLELLAARPMTDDPEIPAGLGYLPRNRDGPYGSGYPYGGSFDHCNGLLLLDGAVVNPATGKWAALPPPPPPPTGSELDFYRDKYLVFDPAVSMHFEVVSIDRLLNRLDSAILHSEWPPSPRIMLVFSSKTWQWEERSFLREGEAAGIIADMRCICPINEKVNSVFWKGELYVQCESNFRMSLSDNKYQLIKPPKGIEVAWNFCLGKSEKGVCCGLVDYSDNIDMCRLRVSVLEELCGQMEWVLKHQTDLQLLLTHHKYDK